MTFYMNEEEQAEYKKYSGVASGKFLLADMVGRLSPDYGDFQGIYENEVVFHALFGDRFVYGIAQGTDCMLSVEINDARLLTEILSKLGVTEFKSEIEYNSQAFSGCTMLHCTFEL